MPGDGASLFFDPQQLMSYDHSLLRPLPKYIRTSGRTSDQLREVQERLRNETYIALTYGVNGKNLEHYWYGISATVLGFLVEGMPNMTVIPQLPLWIPDLDDVPPRNDVDELDVIAPNLPPLRETATLLDDLDHTLTSTALKRYPDFGIVHVIVEAPGDAEQPSETYKALVGNLRPTLDNCLILIELKKHPSRAAPLRRVRALAKYYITMAKFDLMQQSGYHALRYEQEVMRPRTDLKLVAGSGDFWTFGTIPMKYRPRWDEGNGRWDFTEYHREAKWSGIYRLGTEVANKELEKLRKYLEDENARPH